MRRVKPLAYEDEVSLVEHLDELRARVAVSLSVFGVAFALCYVTGCGPRTTAASSAGLASP